jgi:hypothetical protein
MNDENEPRAKAPRKPTRAERLEAELKANLKKRRQQKQAREATPPPAGRDDDLN